MYRREETNQVAHRTRHQLDRERGQAHAPSDAAALRHVAPNQGTEDRMTARLLSSSFDHTTQGCQRLPDQSFNAALLVGVTNAQWLLRRVRY